MQQTPSWKTSFERKETSRHDLKCYVDSWTGPLSGEAKGSLPKPCIYAFEVPETGLIKIGSTSKPIGRLYQLKNIPTSRYAPADTSTGNYIHLEPCGFIDEARTAERLCHRIIEVWRVPSQGRTRRNRNEWYEIEPEVAIRALKLAAFYAENQEHFSNTEHLRDLITFI